MSKVYHVKTLNVYLAEQAYLVVVLTRYLLG